MDYTPVALGKMERKKMQKNFRFSPQTVQWLATMAKGLDISETEVVERSLLASYRAVQRAVQRKRRRAAAKLKPLNGDAP